MFRGTQNHRRGIKRGLGLVEALVSLAITATLLTAVAAAFRASGDAIDLNDNFARATQSARVGMARMLTQVRRGTPATDTTASSLHLLTDTGQDINYNYDSTAQTITLVTNGNPYAMTYSLGHNVTQCTFGKTTAVDAQGTTYVARVTIVLAVNVGGNQILLSGSACPRRNISF